MIRVSILFVLVQCHLEARARWTDVSLEGLISQTLKSLQNC